MSLWRLNNDRVFVIQWLIYQQFQSEPGNLYKWVKIFKSSSRFQHIDKFGNRYRNQEGLRFFPFVQKRRGSILNSFKTLHSVANVLRNYLSKESNLGVTAKPVGPRLVTRFSIRITIDGFMTIEWPMCVWKGKAIFISLNGTELLCKHHTHVGLPCLDIRMYARFEMVDRTKNFHLKDSLPCGVAAISWFSILSGTLCSLSPCDTIC